MKMPKTARISSGVLTSVFMTNWILFSLVAGMLDLLKCGVLVLSMLVRECLISNIGDPVTHTLCKKSTTINNSKIGGAKRAMGR